MKTKFADHIVPLSLQAVALLGSMLQLSREYRYIFPAPRSYKGDRPLSDATLGAALKTMDYDGDTMTIHGFRHSASTLLNESRLWSADAIERQLAHKDRDRIRATYNFAQYLDERREMMQWWADWCDKLRLNQSPPSV